MEITLKKFISSSFAVYLSLSLFIMPVDAGKSETSQPQMDIPISRHVKSKEQQDFPENIVKTNKTMDVLNNPSTKEKADEAQRESVVLLRNENNVLPLSDDKINRVRLYVEMFPGGVNGELTKDLKNKIRNYDEAITISNRLEDSTHAFIWVTPQQDILSKQPMLTIGPENGIDNVNRIVEIQNTIPTITAINMSNPWLIHEIEPNTEALFATFGLKTEALIDVIRGKYTPNGKLPFAIPANQNAVENDKEYNLDFKVNPSYVYRSKNGDAYRENFGLTYDAEIMGRPPILYELLKFIEDGIIDK